MRNVCDAGTHTKKNVCISNLVSSHGAERYLSGVSLGKTFFFLGGIANVILILGLNTGVLCAQVMGSLA